MHEQYSNLGLTRALYAWSLIFCEFTFKCLRRSPYIWFAFDIILLICLPHLRLDCRVTPRLLYQI